MKNTPDKYHQAIILLHEISQHDFDDKQELQRPLQFLKNRRLQALKEEAIKNSSKDADNSYQEYRKNLLENEK